MKTAEALFESLAERLVASNPGVVSPESERSEGRRFGASGLKVDGKIAVMVAKGKLVFKLPRKRVDELVSAGRGEQFSPGGGRFMKEWLALDPQAEVDWEALGAEAVAFVGKLEAR